MGGRAGPAVVAMSIPFPTEPEVDHDTVTEMSTPSRPNPKLTTTR